MPSFFVDPDITIAKTIDTRVYTSPEVFEQLKEKIFAAFHCLLAELLNA